MIRALFFDMDGTLVDTKKANYEAYRAAAKRFGYDFSEKEFSRFHGQHFSFFLPKLIGEESKEIVEKISAEKRKIYPEFSSLARVIPQTLRVLEKYHRDYKTVLVTTASREAVELWFKEFELDKYFDFYICGSDVENKKPDPEAYVIAAKRAEVIPEECLVFEDNQVGFDAAEAAGMNYLDINSPKFKELAEENLMQ